ncbi:MAG TPA: VWA domain-containing protein [Candidatus Angelobacter sp.]|jgi:VWFA-related protein|nr:VWA domain-containing protein [Candidatus Angelobacter sp.]
MQPSLKGLLACACFAFLSFLPINAQQDQAQNQGQQAKPTFRTTTRLVVVDVVVTDKDGNPVKGLKAEDFTVTENNEEQKLADFSFHQPGSVAAAGQQLPANIFTNAPRYSGNSALNVILLDAINTDFSNHAYAQDMLTKYLSTNPKLQPTAVYALENNLRLLHDFTTDPQALRDAITHYKGIGVSHLPTVEAAASPFTQRGTFRNVPQGRGAAFRGMIFLAQTLAGYPGRKNLIWISDGFPISLYPDVTMADEILLTEDFSPMVEKIADDLMASQVALYPISAAGVSKDDQFSAKSAMAGMAQRTGGKTFFNRNDLDTGVRTSLDDGSTYYTLEYYPANRKWDNKFRHIRVKLSKPGMKLQYRDGYYANNPGTFLGTDTMAEEFSQALDINAPALTSVSFQAAVLPPSQQTQNKMMVVFHIDPHTLAFQRGSDGLEHAALNCVAWAYPKKGHPVRAEGGTINAALPAPEFDKIMKSFFPCNRALDLKPGQYTLRLGVLDRTANLIGTLSTPLSVP